MADKKICEVDEPPGDTTSIHQGSSQDEKGDS